MKKAYAVILLFLCAGFVPTHAQVVISQVYGGGGNSGATLRNDFVELFNSGSITADVNGWSVQYASSTGTSWQTTPLTGSLLPGQYYLVQESQGTGGTQNLPTPDATGTLALSATAGKIALTNTTAALSGACPTGSSVVDLIGFGAANCSLGSPAPTLGNTAAAVRGRAGCANSGDNSTDFTASTPLPRNSSSPLSPCSAASGITVTPAALPDGTVNSPYAAAFTASGGTAPHTFILSSGSLPQDLTLSSDGALTGTLGATTGAFLFTVTAHDALGNAGSATYTLTVNAVLTCSATATIAQIQGSGDVSPLNATTVTFGGVVTSTDSSGFFLQMPVGDGNPATSDGIYVYTGAGRVPVTARPGSSLCVTGPVNEFTSSAAPGAATNTEINVPSAVVLISTGNAIPTPITLTPADTDPNGPFDQLEKYEGMRVQVATLRATGPTGGTVDETNARSTSNGRFYGVLTSVSRPFREPGVELPDQLPNGSPCCVTRWDTNPEILGVDSSLLPAPLNVTSGAFVKSLVGPLEYTGGAYTIVLEPTSGPTTAGNVGPTDVPLADASQLTVAAFNTEHFYGTGAPDAGTSHPVLTPTAFANRLNKASLAIRNFLHTPDVLAVEELQNLDTIQALAAKINADSVAVGQPDPHYQAFLSLGNDISGINSGFLVKTPKVSVISVRQYGKNTTYTTPSGTQATLNDRPPLVLTATALREGSDTPLQFTVIVNHLRSLLSIDDPSTGATVRAKREAQAEYLANLIQSFQSADPNANIVSVGDYNAYQFSDGYVDTVGVIKGSPVSADQVILPGPRLVDPILTDLLDTDLIAPPQRYSYTFSGSAQAIDHILVNPNMLSRAVGFAYARIDADFPESFRSDPMRPERVSDHDPVRAAFTLPLVISSKVDLVRSGFVDTNSAGLTAGALTLTNHSSAALPGPIYIGFTNLTSTADLAHESSTQAGTMLIKAAEAGLSPGQSISVPVEFRNSSQSPVTFSTTVYAGTP